MEFLSRIELNNISLDRITILNHKRDRMDDKEEYYKKLKTFFDELKYKNKLYEIFKKEADKKLSSDFNIFDFIKTDELGLSKLIAMMLDSNGEHGQGDLFLKLFINRYGNKKFKTLLNINITVYKEYSTLKNKRIDILLKNKDFAIIIENKPNGVDQKDQITDYIEHMTNNEGYSNKESSPKLLTIYLNQTDKMPNNFSDPKLKKSLEEKRESGEFCIITYNDFSTNFLQECYEKCESEKFRYFISDFMDFVSIKFKKNGE